MALPEFENLELEQDGFVLNVWFNTPENRNALTSGRVSDLRALCEILRASPDIRCVVFRGRGGVFCAGGDLKSFKQLYHGGAGSRDEVHALSLETAEFLQDIYALPQFTIMAIEGAAVAGGFGLACLGDCVLADAETLFSMSETRIGLTPAQIAPYVVQRIGMREGRRLMLTGGRFNGDKALALGLVDELTTGPGEMDAAIARCAVAVTAAAPGALAAIKQQLVMMPGQTRQEQARTAAESFADRMMSDEAREGISAFFEKRKPIWAEG